MTSKDALQKMRDEIRRQNKSYKTEKAYMSWCGRLLQFYNSDISTITKDDIVKYLNHIVIERGVSGSTHNQALCAIVFLFKYILEKDLADLQGLKGNYIPVYTKLFLWNMF